MIERNSPWGYNILQFKRTIYIRSLVDTKIVLSSKEGLPFKIFNVKLWGHKKIFKQSTRCLAPTYLILKRYLAISFRSFTNRQDIYTLIIRFWYVRIIKCASHFSDAFAFIKYCCFPFSRKRIINSDIV